MRTLADTILTLKQAQALMQIRDRVKTRRSPAAYVF